MGLGFLYGEKRLHLFTWLSAIFLIFYITGFEEGYINYYLSAGMVFLYGGFFLLRRKNFTEYVFKDPAFKSFVVFLMIFFYYMSVFGSETAKYCVAQILMFFPLTIYLFFERDKDQLYGILWFTIAAWVFFACRSYYMYSNDLVSARQMASGEVDINVFTGGGYGFAVGSAILAVYCFEMLIWKNVKKHKFWTFAFIVLISLVVYETKSTITTLALACGFGTAVLFRLCGIKTVKKLGIAHLFFLIIVVLLVMLFFLYKEDIGAYILRKTSYSDDIFGIRMREIGVFLSQNQSMQTGAADMTNRLERIMSSWEIFLQNPLFGVTYKYGADSLMLAYFNIGGHGEFMDILARFGLLGGIPYLLIFVFSLLKERRMQKNKIGFGYLMTFAVLFFFNPFIYFQSMTVIFFVLPAVTKLFNSEDESLVDKEGQGKNSAEAKNG